MPCTPCPPAMSGSDSTEQVPSVCGMNLMHERIAASGLPPDIMAFIASSICQLSQMTNESAWQSWATWCAAIGVELLLLENFLYYLLLSYSTMGSSKTLQCFMHVVFFNRPPPRAAPPPPWNMWDIASVLTFLQSWDPTMSLSLCQLSHGTFALFLILSCHCISNLLLLDMRDEFYFNSSVVFQLHSSLDQDRLRHSMPPICFL